MNADALSRANHLDEPTKEENEEYQLENEVGELRSRYRRRSIRNSKGEAEVCRIFACNAHHESENETLDNRRE